VVGVGSGGGDGRECSEADGLADSLCGGEEATGQTPFTCLFAIDQFESGQTALRFTSELAAGLAPRYASYTSASCRNGHGFPPLRLPLRPIPWFRRGY
jgi:hypothetical protein